MLLAALNFDLLNFVWVGLTIICLASILRYFKQPYIIAYILAGVLMGEHGFKIIVNEELIEIIGGFGLILLLFFIGMEISLPDFLKKWKVSTFGTILQVIGSVLILALIGYFFEWQLNRIIVLGFVMSLSSSAVIIKILQDKNQSQSPIGRNVISILLMQDILIVPMIIIANYLGGNVPSTNEVVMQCIGGVLLILGILWILKNKKVNLPFSSYFEEDHELQVFMAFFVCFGFAALTAFFGLSAALGAFFGGMFVHASQSTEWFHDSLHSFRVIFVALFFVSIGMLIDVQFFLENWKIVSVIILASYLSNHIINAAVLHYFGRNWKTSFYGGALLAQIGELSFVLSSSAYAANIITPYGYQLSIIVISLSLLVSPFWVAATERILGIKHEERKSITDS